MEVNTEVQKVYHTYDKTSGEYLGIAIATADQFAELAGENILAGKEPPEPDPAIADQAQADAEAREYLAKTDWYVLRALERPDKPVPDDIATERQAARDATGAKMVATEKLTKARGA